MDNCSNFVLGRKKLSLETDSKRKRVIFVQGFCLQTEGQGMTRNGALSKTETNVKRHGANKRIWIPGLLPTMIELKTF